MQDNHAQDANPAKLYVGNLPYSIDDQALADLFSQHGEVVEAVVIKHGQGAGRLAGKSKGFGFVTMASDEAAQAAIEALNETDMEGRDLVVNVARPMQKRERSFDRRSGGFDRRNRY